MPRINNNKHGWITTHILSALFVLPVSFLYGADAVIWLSTQAKADGSYVSTTEISTDYQEYLSRRIIAHSNAGQPLSTLINELLSRQNSDGGWGDLPGYDSTNVDTAFALEAIGISRFIGVEIQKALWYLSTGQNPDGGWSDAQLC